MNWPELSLLVTGGTGSFGHQFVKTMLSKYHPRRLIVFSRDELKQHDMRQLLGEQPSMRYFIGDVRDKDRLRRAMKNVDVVVHAAALKQVPACEYNPLEAVKTNIEGAANIIDTALDAGVQRVLALSTDKAVNPVNLYGATKLVAEKLFSQGNSYVGLTQTRFSNVRYGNVIGSRGSVIPLFMQQRERGYITVTDERMTRFWLTLEQGVEFVIRCIERMRGGETFVPKIPSMRVVDLAELVAPGCERRSIGIRAGEKLHEMLVSTEESRATLEAADCYVIQPNHPWWQGVAPSEPMTPMAEGTEYSSENNNWWLTSDELRSLIPELH